MTDAYVDQDGTVLATIELAYEAPDHGLRREMEDRCDLTGGLWVLMRGRVAYGDRVEIAAQVVVWG